MHFVNEPVLSPDERHTFAVMDRNGRISIQPESIFIEKLFRADPPELQEKDSFASAEYFDGLAELRKTAEKYLRETLMGFLGHSKLNFGDRVVIDGKIRGMDVGRVDGIAVFVDGFSLEIPRNGFFHYLRLLKKDGTDSAISVFYPSACKMRKTEDIL